MYSCLFICVCCHNTTEPEMSDLLNIVIPKIKAKWKDVAHHMKYKLYEIDAIATDHHNVKDCCVNLLSDWLETCRHPTWQTLLDHLKQDIDLTAAVEEIEKELINRKECVDRTS